MVEQNHQWRLVGPWYRWNTSPEDPGQKRTSRPIIQKYADSHHVEAFMKNPQRSLRYLEEDVVDSGRRKVFLDTHERFYLVTCELHCDTAGFPKVAREKVCEAGFVVRKRKTEIADEVRADVENLLHKMAYERARLQRIQAKKNLYQQPKAGAVTGLGVAQLLKQTVQNARQSTECKYQQRLAEGNDKLKAIVAEHPVTHSVQSWHSVGNGLGYWEDEDDELPQKIEEQVYPLYPLIPDENDSEHASGHQSIWYGLLPVGALQRDSAGNPIFDDKSNYEVRCFVKRHKDPNRPECCNEVIWSRPTETYQLASQFDLIGTSNRMTMIQAPDLKQLADQVGNPNFQIGQGLGVAVASPSESELPAIDFVDGKPSGGPPSALPSICFFAIPLITIVALFLLRLVLPIVVFVFGLWFLLRLKLCILPQISLDIGVEIEAGIEGELAVEAALKLDADIEAEVLSGLAPSMRTYFQEALADPARQDQAYKDLAKLAIDQSIDFSQSGIAPEIVAEIEQLADKPKSSGTSTLPDPRDRLDYYPTKELSEVFA